MIRIGIIFLLGFWICIVSPWTLSGDISQSKRLSQNLAQNARARGDPLQNHYLLLDKPEFVDLGQNASFACSLRAMGEEIQTCQFRFNS